MKHRHKTSLNSSGVNNNERGGRRRLKTVETSSPASKKLYSQYQLRSRAFLLENLLY